MGLDEQEKPIRQQPKSDETTSKAHLKPVWMGILPAVTMIPAGLATRMPWTWWPSRFWRDGMC